LKTQAYDFLADHFLMVNSMEPEVFDRIVSFIITNNSGL